MPRKMKILTIVNVAVLVVLLFCLFVLISDVSGEDDHPNMIYMRKYGQVDGLPSEEKLQTMQTKEVLYSYHSYLDNTDYPCRRKLRMGNIKDGGWEVCDDYEFRPIRPCIVYSFGINFDFSFDDDVGRLYGCKVYSFDPSMNRTSHRRSKTVQFYNLGLGGSGGKLPNKKNWPLKTLSDIKMMLKHQHTTIDMIKIDIEGSEWPALVDILAKEELSQVRQLQIEYHAWNPRRWMLLILKHIHDLGFRRFYTHLNTQSGEMYGHYPIARGGCYEMHYVNTRFARQPPAVQ